VHHIGGKSQELSTLALALIEERGKRKPIKSKGISLIPTQTLFLSAPSIDRT
jgi:hypothetical protein